MCRTGYVPPAATIKDARSLRSPLAPDAPPWGCRCPRLSIFMRIAVDVMGGDHGCGVVIEGVKRALAGDSKITELFLVGKEEEIQAALRASQLSDSRVRVVHASEVMTMEDKPTAAFRKKKDSSM